MEGISCKTAPSTEKQTAFPAIFSETETSAFLNEKQKILKQIEKDVDALVRQKTHNFIDSIELSEKLEQAITLLSHADASIREQIERNGKERNRQSLMLLAKNCSTLLTSSNRINEKLQDGLEAVIERDLGHSDVSRRIFVYGVWGPLLSVFAAETLLGPRSDMLPLASTASVLVSLGVGFRKEIAGFFRKAGQEIAAIPERLSPTQIATRPAIARKIIASCPSQTAL